MGYLRHNVRNAAGRFISRAAARNPYIALGIAAGGTAYRAYNYYNSLPQSQNNSYNTPINRNITKMGQNTTAKSRPRSRVNVRVRSRTTRTTMLPMSASLGNAKMKRSSGLVIGTRSKQSFRQLLQATLNPPLKFDSKWTFQMDATSGRVNACTIPILNKDLLDPIYAQLFTNATTDTTTVDPTLTQLVPTGYLTPTVNTGQFNYKAIITSYLSTLKFYNSSTNTAKCRLVWYKPRTDIAPYTLINAQTPIYLPTGPLNVLAYASSIANNGLGFPNLAVNTSGLVFSTSEVIANYDHAGWPTTGGNTTASSSANTVLELDPALVPGSLEVRSFMSRYWTTLKSEEFTLEPGNQFNTSLRMRNRVVARGNQNSDTYYYKDASVVGILYVLGQMVFNDTTGSSAISTGSCQISCMREDSCLMRVDTRKNPQRYNLTNPYQVILNADQGIINTKTDDIDTTYDQES